jgi:hypothetical protein
MYVPYGGLKSTLGIWKQIRLDLDLFGQIQILERAMAVRGLIFHTHSQIGIPVIANPPDLRTLILHQQMRYSTDCSFETANFSSEKSVRELILGVIYNSMALSQPQSRDTVPIK